MKYKMNRFSPFSKFCQHLRSQVLSEGAVGPVIDILLYKNMVFGLKFYYPHKYLTCLHKMCSGFVQVKFRRFALLSVAVGVLLAFWLPLRLLASKENVSFDL